MPRKTTRRMTRSLNPQKSSNQRKINPRKRSSRLLVNPNQLPLLTMYCCYYEVEYQWGDDVRDWRRAVKEEEASWDVQEVPREHGYSHGLSGDLRIDPGQEGRRAESLWLHRDATATNRWGPWKDQVGKYCAKYRAKRLDGLVEILTDMLHIHPQSLKSVNSWLVLLDCWLHQNVGLKSTSGLMWELSSVSYRL